MEAGKISAICEYSPYCFQRFLGFSSGFGGIGSLVTEFHHFAQSELILHFRDTVLRPGKFFALGVCEGLLFSYSDCRFPVDLFHRFPKEKAVTPKFAFACKILSVCLLTILISVP